MLDAMMVHRIIPLCYASIHLLFTFTKTTTSPCFLVKQHTDSCQISVPLIKSEVVLLQSQCLMVKSLSLLVKRQFLLLKIANIETNSLMV